MVAQSTIDEIESKTDIVEVISGYLKLKQKGASIVGNCPFHGENTPSFHVSKVKQMFKCFGCGIGGNAIKFIMEHDKSSYPEALKVLALKYNIEFVETGIDDKTKASNMVRDDILAVNEYASKLFFSNISQENANFSGNKVYQKAIDYLKERGLNSDIVEKFKIGYAPAGYRETYEKILKAKYSHEQTAKADLIIEFEGKILDKFRDRIVFPIQNLSGRVVGFTARILTNDKNLPKYLNTAENEAYHKKETLYGLYQAKDAIKKKDRCFLTEGQMDVISCHKGGIENIVASSGTSLTIEQIRLIKRSTNKITILYDGDKAGIKAAERGMELIIKEGLSVKVLLFPDGMDPDSFINEHGAEKLLQFIEENQMDIIDFFYNGWDTMSIEQKDERGASIANLIAKIPEEGNYFRIQKHIEKLARIFNTTPAKVNERIAKIRGKLSVKETLSEMEIQKPNEANYELEFAKALMLYGPETYWYDTKCYYHMLQNCGLPERFRNPTAIKILNSYLGILNEGVIPDIDYFMNHEDDEIRDIAITCSLTQSEVSEYWIESDTGERKVDAAKIVKNVTSYLKVFKLKELRSEASSQLREEKASDKIKELFEKQQRFTLALKKECAELGIKLI